MSKFKILTLSALELIVPITLFAQERDAAISNDCVAYASVFAGDLSLLLSIIIGIMGVSFVFRAARKMGGGLFGSILSYIGAGMVFMVLGTISMVFDNWFVGVWFSIVNTACFALGYIFIVIGANKLLKGIINT